MIRKALCLALVLGLVSIPLPLPAQTPTSTMDADVVRGIAQVDDGDYDAAILTLDNAARRLASDPKRTGDLSQAYLYIGIAYLGKGHEAAARAKFREALGQIKDLTLSPEKFPPKVIDAFEAAKEEAEKNAPAAAAATTNPAGAPATPEKKKGGSGKVILIVGGLAAAGAIAAAAGGGGGSKSSSSSSPTTTTQPPDPRQTLGPYALNLPNSGGDYDCRTAVPTKAGSLDARVTWTKDQLSTGVGMYCKESGSETPCSTGQAHATSNTSEELTTTVDQKSYDVCVYNHSGVQDTFTLTILIP